MARRGYGEGSITKRPDGRYHGRVSLGTGADGKRRRRSVYGRTRREVIEKMRELQNDPRYARRIDVERITLHQAYEYWLDSRRHELQQSTIDRHNSTWNREVAPRIGGLRLPEIDPLHIDDMYKQMAEAGKSKREIAYARMLVTAVLEQAAARRHIPFNPARAAARWTWQPDEARAMQQDELALFFKHAREQATLYLNGYVLALDSGMRPGEWRGLQWQFVDWDGCRVRVEQALHEARTGEMTLGQLKWDAVPRWVDLSDQGMEALRRQRILQEQLRKRARGRWRGHEWDLVVTNTVGAPGKYSRAVDQWLRPVREAAGLDWVTFHTFRHTHASILIYKGVDIVAIADRLGHRDPSITMKYYAHMMKGQAERVAGKLNAFFATELPRVFEIEPDEFGSKTGVQALH